MYGVEDTVVKSMEKLPFWSLICVCVCVCVCVCELLSPVWLFANLIIVGDIK